MSSVLFGNTGFTEGNRLKTELTRLQNQINSLKQENQFLVTALSSSSPDVVAAFEKMRADAAAKAVADAEAARQEAARQRAMEQNQRFNNRR